MQKSYDHALVDFLARAENVRFAIEVGERVGLIKAQLGQKFWNLVKQELANQLAREKLDSAWRIEDLFLEKGPLNEYAGLILQPRATGDLLGVAVQIEQGRLFYSVRRVGDIYQASELASVGRLRSLMEEDKFVVKHNKTFVGWNRLEVWVNGPDFFEDVARGNVDRIADAADPVIGLLKNYLPLIEAANHEISALKGNS